MSQRRCVLRLPATKDFATKYAVHFIAASLTLGTSTLEKLRHLPRESWINFGICLIGIFVVVRLWRTLKQLNDYAPYMAMVVMGTGVFFYWVYTRTEPAILTPVVEKLAPFFPSETKQQEYVDRARHNRED